MDSPRDTATKVSEFADDAGNFDIDEAHDVGRAVQQNPIYQTFVTVGLCVYGLVHIAIAYVALNIAFSGPASQTSASNSGVLNKVSNQPFGGVVLVVAAVGLAALVVWQLLEAAVGHTHVSGAKRLHRRLSSLGRAIVYIALTITTVSAIFGSAGGEAKQESMVAKVLNLPAGPILVGAIAVGILAAAISQIVKGIRRSFTDDLDGSVATWTIVLGSVGYITKGVAISIVGLMFGFAAIQHNAQAAGDTNSALRTIVDQPFGPALLSAVALGLIAFGAFCFVWAFNAKHEKDSPTRKGDV